MHRPLVTVGMPVYNGHRFLSQAIRSVLCQTYGEWELLIIDDGSSDQSYDMAASFRDHRIRILRHDRNVGLVAARNQILDEATGAYIAWLDQDDLAYPSRLTTQVEHLRLHPETAICGSWTNLRFEETDGTSRLVRKRLQVSPVDIRAQMIFSSPLMCNTVMMRRESVEQEGLRFRDAYGNALDYDMWSKASDTLGLHNIPKVLGEYRSHGAQTSRGNRLEKMNASALEIIRQLIVRTLGINWSPSERAIHQRLAFEPDSICDRESLLETASWLAVFRRANQREAAFDSLALDRALARQWLGALRRASSSGLHSGQLAPVALSGVREIGIRPTELTQQLASGIVQLLERSMPNWVASRDKR